MESHMNVEELAAKLVSWIREQVLASGRKGVVLGISGGVDSSVVAVLCHQALPQNTLGVLMPCYSSPEDEEHALAMAGKFSISTKTVALDSVFDTLAKALPDDSADQMVSRLAKANLKVRLRMLTLYHFANQLNYMVVGASNRSELAIGYFTKYGDGGGDILPLCNLVKGQVKELASSLGIPQEIINKPPSAGLWEGQVLAGFFLQLPDDECRAIYEFLKKGDHHVDLDNTYSAWHQINHGYEERFDANNYLETCRKYLPNNWRYGLPLVDDALNQNNYQLAESLLIKTFSSYLGGERKKKWRPENSLLLTERRSFLSAKDEEIGTLLNTWADVAKQLKEKGRCAAAQFQAVAFNDSENWDMVLKTYQHLSKGIMKKKLVPLFAQWKNEMAARSYPYFLDSHKVADTWVHWLIEALLDEKKDGGQFLNKVAGWLIDLEKHPKALKQQWLWLGLFTRDLHNGEKIKTEYPSFWRTVIPEDNSGRDLAQSRSKGLRKMKAGSYLTDVLEIWKKHLRRIIPDPANAHKSNYEEYACWAEALLELNKDEYHALIAQWRRKHNRRRNLWRDLKAISLPVD